VSLGPGLGDVGGLACDAHHIDLSDVEGALLVDPSWEEVVVDQDTHSVSLMLNVMH